MQKKASGKPIRTAILYFLVTTLLEIIKSPTFAAKELGMKGNSRNKHNQQN